MCCKLLFKINKQINQRFNPQFISDQVNEFKHQFEMILEGEKGIDTARSKFNNCENMEHKARKELKKIQKRRSAEDVRAFESRVIECERQRELAQTEGMLL